MYYLKKLNMICFDAKEMENLYEATQKKLLLQELYKTVIKDGISLVEIEKDKQKVNQIVDLIVAKGLKDKSDIEFFIALDFCLSFYEKSNSNICFVLKNGVKLNKLSIKDLNELKKVVKEDTLTDFAIFFNDTLREFQLKQYKGELKIDELFNFIKRQLAKYGNNLGSVNLLIVLQGNGSNNSKIDFNKIHEKIENLKLNFSGEILIIHNEQNNFNVINQVYPDIKSMRKRFNLPSVKWL